MKSKAIYIIATLICSANFVVAATIQPEKCASIQDSKKRLVCYDLQAKGMPPESSPISIDKQVQRPESMVQAPPKTDRVIKVEAGIVYKSGDVKPVARTTFYLLDKSLVDIFREANLKPPIAVDENEANYQELIYPTAIVMMYGKIKGMASNLDPKSDLRIFYDRADGLIVSHIIARAETSFGGEAKFEALKPGVYYLMGVYKTQRGAAIWNLKVNANAPETSITLDQNNAASVD